MKSHRRVHQTLTLYRVQQATRSLLLSLLYVLLLSSARTSAQIACGTTHTTRIQVDNSTGTALLRAALNCTGGGQLEANWTGRISVGAPITVLEGTFLSVTGENAEAEVYGGDTQTRLFEVSQGGGLVLSRLKLSGGSASGGGAIYSKSAGLALDNCVFDGNAATEGNGGAVWADGGNVTIVGGEFLDNSATRYGGAVHFVDGNLVVRGGSRFEGNTAIGGGALFCGLSNVGSDKQAAACSIAEAEFMSNSAARDIQAENYKEEELDVVGFSYLDGGGAAMFLFASVDITDSVFSGNYALLSGGALHGGIDTSILVIGCTFGNNTSGKYAGAISVSSMTLGGGTQVTQNLALDDGGAIFGWDTDGTITFNDVLCAKNWATNDGGCLYGLGRGIFNDGVAMLDNRAVDGGCIYAGDGGNMTVSGGTFTCQSSARGGFLYAGDGTRVKITGAVVTSNLAGKRGGALYCSGNAESDILIEGGTFRDNKALESGGAIAFWGGSTLVTITGGTFQNNNATFYGGFVFVETGASMKCEGVIIEGNYAGEQGGGIYAREATWVNSSCDLVGNESPQGAALYLTNVESATFESHNVTNNLASGGSVVYMTASPAVARRVTFESGVVLQDDRSNRAIQLEGDTTLAAEDCVFDGWLGDTIIYHKSSGAGSLIINSCDFSGSSAAMAVISPHSDAEIRNAVVGDRMFANASTVSSSLELVDRALDCKAPHACGTGQCVDSLLGVLCECLEDGECLDDGGKLSLDIGTHPDEKIFSPELVSYELVVSSSVNGTTYAIWDLTAEDGDLHLESVPSSGILPPGGDVVIKVVGTPTKQDMGGNLTSRFSLASVGNASTNSTGGDVKLEVTSTFYLCPSFEYAKPRANGADDGVMCEQCATISGDKGVNCDLPGATLTSLPIRPGYWRSGITSRVVHKCFYSAACVGGTEISSADDYCEAGYKGPYCSVCADGYGRSVSNTCHSCGDTKARMLNASCALFSVMTLLLLFLAVVFLIGGLEAVEMVRQSARSSASTVGRVFGFRRLVPEANRREERDSHIRVGENAWNGGLAPVIDVTQDFKGGGGGHGHGFSRGLPSNRSEPDEPDRTYPQPLGAAVGVETRVGLPPVGGRHTPMVEAISNDNRHNRRSSLPYADVTGAVVGRRIEGGAVANPKECGFTTTIKHWSRRFPVNKIKIFVGVWQILAVFSSITGVEYPASYSLFLSWINVLNFDLGYIASASCALPHVNFYQSLLVTTLGPFVVAAGLALTYRTAKRRAGIGSVGVMARRAAWSRHVAAVLLLTFLVFTSASSAVFKTFACDDGVLNGQSYLRADYSISCNSRRHEFFRFYAGLMILVYPMGIPVLYTLVLWKHRDILNPRIVSGGNPGDDGANEDDIGAGFGRTFDTPTTILLTAPNGQTKAYWSPQELQELDERVKARTKHPELVPFMFLWRDFGPDLYYYEVIECGRRILLTEVLIFIAPNTSIQAAMACIFAFVSLLGFELTRPHADPADSWLYRLGCVIIFLSYFLALLIKMDATGEANRSAFGGFLVAVNVLLVVAVLFTAWFAIRQMVDDSHDDDDTSA